MSSGIHPITTHWIRRRELLGITSFKLSQLTGFSANAVDAWEKGHRWPTLTSLEKVLPVLGLGLLVVVTQATPCPTCHDAPPYGFTCNTCDLSEGGPS